VGTGATSSSYAPTIMSSGEGGSTRTGLQDQLKEVAVSELFAYSACSTEFSKSNSTRARKYVFLADFTLSLTNRASTASLPQLRQNNNLPCLFIMNKTERPTEQRNRIPGNVMRLTQRTQALSCSLNSILQNCIGGWRRRKNPDEVSQVACLVMFSLHP